MTHLPFTAHLVFVADVPSEGKSGRLPSWPGRCLPNRPPPQLWGNRWCGGVGVAALRDHVCSTVAFPSVLWLAGRPSPSKATLTLGLACSNRPTTLTAALPAKPSQFLHFAQLQPYYRKEVWLIANKRSSHRRNISKRQIHKKKWRRERESWWDQ